MPAQAERAVGVGEEPNRGRVEVEVFSGSRPKGGGNGPKGGSRTKVSPQVSHIPILNFTRHNLRGSKERKGGSISDRRRGRSAARPRPARGPPATGGTPPSVMTAHPRPPG
jgi:hypothetical protein